MTLSIEVASNAAASAWTDHTGVIDLPSIRLAGTANRGEIGTGSGWDLDNDAGTITIPVRRVVRAIEDATTPDTVMFRGRVVQNTKARGSNLTEPANALDVNLVDYNADLGGIPIARVTRPAETDVARITWLLSTYLQGSPRASTDLVDTYLQATDPVDLLEHEYEDVKPIDIIADVISQTGKQCFITVDGEFFYGPVDSVVYAASLSITDVSPDYSASFPPDDAAAMDEDGTEFFSRVKVVYRGNANVTVSRSAVETAHDYWGTTIIDTSIPNATAATARANVFLDEFDHPEERYRCNIKLTAAQVDLVKYGQTVSFRSAACGVLTPISVRVARLQWSEFTPGVYKAELELGYPAKLVPRIGPGGIGSGGSGGPTDGGGQEDCCPPFDGIGTPDPGQPVLNELVATGDGTTDDWTTDFPYTTGSLRVWVDGVNVTGEATEDDNTTGAFSLSFAPLTGEAIRVSYNAA